MLNGRKTGDLMGNLTCVTARGSSAVDYGLVSPAIFNKINDFLVGDIMPPISDHAPIAFSLAVNANVFKESSTSKLLAKPDKIEWGKDLANRFTVLLQGPACKEVLSDITLKGVSDNQAAIDATATLFSELLTGTAKLSGMSIKKGRTPRKSSKFSKFTKVKPPKWHDASCHEAFLKIKATSKYAKNVELCG